LNFGTFLQEDFIIANTNTIVTAIFRKLVFPENSRNYNSQVIPTLKHLE